ncbi:hypothetical protein [Amycolatopsis sp. NPDC051903]|uniref:hypothetical protein n=1 Tax=Amycolatopsis sp. NPDC051903 TaxID=3363936 RepID=UPI0037A5EB22
MCGCDRPLRRHAHRFGTFRRYARHDLGPAPRAAVAFGSELLDAAGHTVPSGIVIDVGTPGGDGAVIEANAAWASGCYTADPDIALAVILRGPSDHHGPHPGSTTLRQFTPPAADRGTDERTPTYLPRFIAEAASRGGAVVAELAGLDLRRDIALVRCEPLTQARFDFALKRMGRA